MMLDIDGQAYRDGVEAERERCLDWIRHGRERGETDLRQIRAWVESGDQPPDGEES